MGHTFVLNNDGEGRCLDCDCRQGGTASRGPCSPAGEARFARDAEAWANQYGREPSC